MSSDAASLPPSKKSCDGRNPHNTYQPTPPSSDLDSSSEIISVRDDTSSDRKDSNVHFSRSSSSNLSSSDFSSSSSVSSNHTRFHLLKCWRCHRIFTGQKHWEWCDHCQAYEDELERDFHTDLEEDVPEYAEMRITRGYENCVQQGYVFGPDYRGGENSVLSEKHWKQGNQSCVQRVLQFNGDPMPAYSKFLERAPLFFAEHPDNGKRDLDACTKAQNRELKAAARRPPNANPLDFHLPKGFSKINGHEIESVLEYERKFATNNYNVRHVSPFIPDEWHATKQMDITSKELFDEITAKKAEHDNNNITS